MESVTLRTVEGHTAVVYKHGAHVTSWKTPDGAELLFVSKKAIFAPPKAIRGGVPVCFPQFGMMGPLSTQHGFARNVPFEVESQEDWKVTMVLKYPGSGQAGWDHAFELRVTTALCDHVLTQELHVTNTGASELAFTTALHTYFTVQDITQVKVEGLQGVEYLDNLAKQERKTEREPTITFTGEVDRVYVGAPPSVKIVDGASGREVDVTRVNFPDAVVWNPWVDKAAAMADFGDEEYKEMLCIEPAVAGSGPVTLAPGAAWSGKQVLTYKLP